MTSNGNGTMQDDDPTNPWSGAGRDKLRHPKLGRFVDNIWVLFLNRIILPSLGAIIIAVSTWGIAKVNLLDDLARDVPTLVAEVKKIADEVTAEGIKQTTMIDHIKSAERDIEGLKAAGDENAKAIASAQAEAAAAKARVDDIKDDLKKLEIIAQKNLDVSQSHDADIRATRNAVAPRDPVER